MWQQYHVVLFSFGLVTSIASRQANMNYEGILSGAALQRVRIERSAAWKGKLCVLEK